MATSIVPPSNMNFEEPNLAEAWRDWRQEIELYLELVDNGKCKEDRKKSLLRYHIGKAGRAILAATPEVDEDNPRSWTHDLDILEDYCKPQKNLILDTYRFLTRKQETEESFDKYLIELKKLASKCELDTMKDRLIMQVIVVGIQDSKLREKMLRNEKLDLTKAINTCRAAEAAKKQAEVIEGDEKDEGVNYTREKNLQRGDRKQQNKSRKCKYCDKSHIWGARNCPAYGKDCSKCGRQNHFASCCMSNSRPQKQVNEIEDDEEESETDEHKALSINDQVMGMDHEMQVTSKRKRHLLARMIVQDITGHGSRSVVFQLDSGATCNCIPVEKITGWEDDI